MTALPTETTTDNFNPKMQEMELQMKNDLLRIQICYAMLDQEELTEVFRMLRKKMGKTVRIEDWDGKMSPRWIRFHQTLMSHMRIKIIPT